MSIIACYFIAKTLLLWDPRDIVQIAYHLRKKSPLHFATSRNTLQQSQLHTWQSQLHTLCQKTHNFRQLVWKNLACWRITSTDATCQIFPKILLNARKKPRFAASREHLTVRNLPRYTPRYLISDVHGIEWPVKLVIVAQTTSLRGPICKHEDLLKLIDVSSHASSTSHLCKQCCKRVTDGVK